MKQRGFTLLLIVIAAIIVTFSQAPIARSQGGGQLKMVFIEVDSADQLEKLAGLGIDIAAVREGPEKEGPRGVASPTYRVEAVISPLDEAGLTRAGFKWREAPQAPAISALSAAPSASQFGFNVYRSFDEDGGIEDQLKEIARENGRLTRLVKIGRSLQKRPIYAMRLTNERKRGHKAEVLYIATTHAREWVATEVAMRLIRYLIDNHGVDPRVTHLLDTTEIWIIPVHNPDGYEYTFTTDRLWRKNLRDNDKDGEITLLDGVDINRNFDSHWGLDDEGSNPDFSDQTYRGSKPNSEPETRALIKFINKHDFKFTISYHTYSNLILYPYGWQVKTPSFDDPIFVAQAGTDENPAIVDSIIGAGYDPGVGADLYITNGEYTDWAYDRAGLPGYTVELTPGQDAAGNFYGFVFPDDEGLLQQVFEDNLEFALAVAEGAKDPAHPVSPVGIEAEDAYHTPVTQSNGTDQMIEILARKGLDLSLNYNINGGSQQSTGFHEEFGDQYNTLSGIYYSRYVAHISGQQADDVVTYSITAGDLTFGPYSYNVNSATGNPILILAAEDYTGTNPTYGDTSGPNYLQYYTAALDAGGYAYDVWDVDTQGIPTYAEVLSHYDVVIWYTGDDYAARIPLGLGTQEVEVLNIRDFINYGGGKVFATGQDISWLAATAAFYSDDFFQYYLSALNHVEGGGIDGDTGLPFDIKGEFGDPILGGLAFSLHNENGGDGANNQAFADTFLPTSAFLPHFSDTIIGRYDRPGSPFEPNTGSYYVYSQRSDRSYKRLGGTFTIPAAAPTLRFWISYDIETDWDYAFVEINPVGANAWTTLPDANGLTQQGTGQSCASGWVDQIHGFLANYMDAGCAPTGATGVWNAFTGNSGGWRQVEMDLSAYAGQDVELYISYASDWGTQNLGVFVDDIELGNTPVESFESGLGQWSVSVGPGSTAVNNWERITAAGFPEGPAISTNDTVYFGFGFEAIDTAENRNAVMDRVMQYLLADH